MWYIILIGTSQGARIRWCKSSRTNRLGLYGVSHANPSAEQGAAPDTYHVVPHLNRGVSGRKNLEVQIQSYQPHRILLRFPVSVANPSPVQEPPGTDLVVPFLLNWDVARKKDPVVRMQSYQPFRISHFGSVLPAPRPYREPPEPHRRSHLTPIMWCIILIGTSQAARIRWCKSSRTNRLGLYGVSHANPSAEQGAAPDTYHAVPHLNRGVSGRKNLEVQIQSYQLCRILIFSGQCCRPLARTRTL